MEEICGHHKDLLLLSGYVKQLQLGARGNDIVKRSIDVVRVRSECQSL